MKRASTTEAQALLLFVSLTGCLAILISIVIIASGSNIPAGLLCLGLGILIIVVPMILWFTGPRPGSIADRTTELSSGRPAMRGRLVVLVLAGAVLGAVVARFLL